MRRQFTALVVLTAVSAVTLSSALLQADPSKRERTGAISRPQFDPTAERVELFAGMKDGSLETKVIATLAPQ